jgi:hypothetical protein
LKYDIGNASSYVGSGNVLIDLKGNSNATLLGTPTSSYSAAYGGYLTVTSSATNQYILTNTDLSSKFSGSSPNKSSITSVFVWVYPTGNGVIVDELGQATINTGWHDSQIEMVGGTLYFNVWNGGTAQKIASSVATPFNLWHYVGFTYDGTTLRAYVNSQLAGSVVGARSTPYNDGSPDGLYYGIAANDGTSLGDGSYAKMKLGAFHVYNKALSSKEISDNYTVTKSDYIYTSSNNILFYIDANDPQSYSGVGSNILDLSGNGITHTMTNATQKTIFGVKCFDCTATNNVIRSSVGLTLSTSGYTYVSWARIMSSNATFRTLFRTAPNDHPLLINLGTNTLGSYDNDTNLFYSAGYDITNIIEKWVQWTVVGDSSGSTFYINGDLVGTSTKSASGNKHDYISLDGQSFGYIANTILYNAKLTQDQVKQNYDALKHVYETSNFVTNNLKLAYSPNNGNSSTWYDIKGTNNATLTGSPTYSTTGYTFNGTTQYGRIVSSSGITDFTNTDNYTVELWFKPSTGQPWPTTTILEKWNLNNIGRYPYTFRYTESTGVAYVAAYDGTNFPLVSSTGFSVNTWHQIVATFNFTTDFLTVYKNGVSVGSVSLVGVGNISNTSPVGIAHRVSVDGSSAEFMYKGSIGIIRIYNSALSASDVLTNFNASRNIYGI